jgi:GNAT superfamily N-acetyltransferase
MHIGPMHDVLSPDDRVAFDRVVGIYQDAIVPSEQKSVAELTEMLGNPRYRVVVARLDTGIVGFAICFFPERANFWLLEYMAVDRASRSHGMGAALFVAAKRLAATIAADAPCILEVDQPPKSEADSEAARRLRFYGRLGCRRVEALDYFLPLHAAGQPPPMWLLVHGMEGCDAVPVSQVKGWLEAIYSEVYDKRVDDARFNAMLSSVSSRGSLGLLSLG